MTRSLRVAGILAMTALVSAPAVGQPCLGVFGQQVGTFSRPTQAQRIVSVFGTLTVMGPRTFIESFG